VPRIKLIFFIDKINSPTMPNMTGGKGYKRGKHSSKEEKMIEWDEASGEMLGRVINVVGSRRFIVYCNDNKTRSCRLAGSIPKSDWVSIGAIVLVSIRLLPTSTTEGSGSAGKSVASMASASKIGDITNVFGSEFYKDLKDIPSTNRAIFMQVERKLEEVMKLVESGTLDQDDLFLHEGEEDETVAEKNIREEQEDLEKKAKFAQSVKERDIAIKSRRTEKEVTFDEL
jgi:translation initiation factor IF-1